MRVVGCRAHPDDSLQEGERLVNGGFRVKTQLAMLKLVMQDALQSLRQGLCLLLQPELLLMQSHRILLQLLVVPVPIQCVAWLQSQAS